VLQDFSVRTERSGSDNISAPDNYSTDISSVNVSFTSFDPADALLFCEVRVNGAARASVNASRYVPITLQ